MSKQYGLIIPGQQKKPSPAAPKEVSRPSVFDESSSESDGNGPPQMQMKKAPLGPSLMEKRKARDMQEKALAEDPTIFQYDELYDEMENKREEEQEVKSKEPKKAKYISKLMESAERRKLENELRIERQVQKEREAEGEEFRDKESFVTSTYRKKLEEMRKLEEQNQRDDYLEAIGDVTKQKDLDGFYRHLYEQKMGTSKDVKKPELRPEVTTAGDADKDETENSISYKPIKSGKVNQQRAYRKRHSSDEEEELTEASKNDTLKDDKEKKMHLTNNIDADSDFSIDDSSSDSSSSSEDENGAGGANQQVSTVKKSKKSKDKIKDASKEIKTIDMPGNTIALNLDSLKKDKSDQKDDKSAEKDNNLPIPSTAIELEDKPLPKPKKDKTEIWKKRTVGEVYEAAVKRYYERKAARNQA